MPSTFSGGRKAAEKQTTFQNFLLSVESGLDFDNPGKLSPQNDYSTSDQICFSGIIQRGCKTVFESLMVAFQIFS